MIFRVKNSLLGLTGTATSLFLIYGAICSWRYFSRAIYKWKKLGHIDAKDSLFDLIGETPLIELKSLSKMTNCRVFAKMESLNPGGSSKDRVAKRIILNAEKSGALSPNFTIYEGSAGSTGISLAWMARLKGYRCHIFMPDDQAREKSDILQALGACVERVPPASIVDPEHIVNIAKRRAADDPYGFFADQFENLANYQAHFETTGPEIWRQTKGTVDALVASAGTGGAIAGISHFLKGKNSAITVFLADPQGSGLHNLVSRGVCFSNREIEGKRKRHQVDTIVEGVGLNRVTANFNLAQIDGSFSVSDQEVVSMAQFLLDKEGIFAGSSSALNCVGVVQAAKVLGPNKTIVTIINDNGQRHLSKLWNREYLLSKGLV